MPDTIVAFIEARHAEQERTATDRLCITCGHPTKPVYNTLGGIIDYTHRWWRDPETGKAHGWQGVRCDGGVTGAEPMQDPDRVLADVAARRALLAALEDNVRYWSSDDHSRAAAEMALEAAQRYVAAPFATHPDFKPAWGADD